MDRMDDWPEDLGRPGAGAPEGTAESVTEDWDGFDFVALGVTARRDLSSLFNLAREMRAVCERRRDWDVHASRFVD